MDKQELTEVLRDLDSHLSSPYLEDLELLLPQMSEADKGTLVATIRHVGTFRPDWAQRIRYFLLEQGWKIE